MSGIGGGRGMARGRRYEEGLETWTGKAGENEWGAMESMEGMEGGCCSKVMMCARGVETSGEEQLDIGQFLTVNDEVRGW